MIKSRLHVYNPSGPKHTAYLIADRSGLKILARALKNAADSAVGMETVRMFSSDGHEYDILITCDVTDEEWQQIEPAYSSGKTPKLRCIQEYLSIKKELDDARTNST